MSHFVSTTIPYVNGAPHIGHAQEFVLADALRRSYGDDVYFQSGVDENSLKNVLAAQAAGMDTATYVARRSDEFEQLTSDLGLDLTDFVRTGTDPRHRPVVEYIWNACVESGDIYQAPYTGLYCVGCEQFYTDGELQGGACPEHGVAPERISETNYFFRLTRHRQRLVELLSTRRIDIEPAAKRNEMLRYLEQLSEDLSISRSAQRARGWGIPVPGDPTQIVYVWIDALANYVSAPGLDRWDAFDRVTHVVGKGVLRFHAIYWPAVLLSAGLRLPDAVFVHDYVTVEGLKIGKSLGNVVAPAEPIRALGLDAFRYYLLRHVGCYKDGDFSWQRYGRAYEQELANQLGNLVSRVTALARTRDALPAPSARLHADLDRRIAKHVAVFALHKAMDEIWKAIERTNAFVGAEQPWKTSGERQAATLATAVDAIRTIARALVPFLPDTSAKIGRALDGAAHEPLFPRDRAQAAVRNGR